MRGMNDRSYKDVLEYSLMLEQEEQARIAAREEEERRQRIAVFAEANISACISPVIQPCDSWGPGYLVPIGPDASRYAEFFDVLALHRGALLEEMSAVVDEGNERRERHARLHRELETAGNRAEMK